MLLELSIRNIAIIESLHVSFGRGLNILTGETGAGKSIIIDAVSLILGGRASADLIRTGEEEARVEAVFSVGATAAVRRELEEAGLDDGDEVVVARTVSRSGRNRVFLNGSLSTTGVLSRIASKLVNIYGQHESQTLLKPVEHLEILDSFARLQVQRDDYASTYRHLRRLQQMKDDLQQGERELARRIDLLSFQVQEIGDAALMPGEEEELHRERLLLANAEKLQFAARQAFDALYAEEPSALSLAAGAAARVRECSAMDPTLEPLNESLANVEAELEDVALTLRKYLQQVEADPQRLEEVQTRIELIRKLKSKYGGSIEEVLAFAAAAAEELDGLRNREETLGTLDRDIAEAERITAAKGQELSKARREGAARLEKAMKEQIADLGMKNAHFSVCFSSLQEPGATGLDTAEFFFSPNAGEEPKPLSRIASGGELSRLMLALKQVHPESEVPTLIFDEVDTGIGGAVSRLIGAKLKKVADEQQVLCITHLPQVAAFADSHFTVEKIQRDGRTATSVRHLQEDERLAELARMLGGKVTERALEHARELVEEQNTMTKGNA